MKNILKPKSEKEIWDHLLTLTADEILITSTRHCFYEGIVYSLEKGADIDASNGYALQLAMKHNDISLTEFLLDQGASPNIRTIDNRTLLDNAIIYSKYNFIELLYKRGADHTIYYPHYEKDLKDLFKSI